MKSGYSSTLGKVSNTGYPVLLKSTANECYYIIKKMYIINNYSLKNITKKLEYSLTHSANLMHPLHLTPSGLESAKAKCKLSICPSRLLSMKSLKNSQTSFITTGLSKVNLPGES